VRVGTGGQNNDGKVLDMRIAVGDRVLFMPNFSNSLLRLDGREHYLLPEEGILAILTDETEDDLGEEIVQTIIEAPHRMR